MGIRPTSFCGAWAVSLAITFILLFVGIPYAARFVSSNKVLIGIASGMELGLIGTSGLVLGVVSIIRSKERSVFVILSLLVGVFALGFLLASVAWMNWSLRLPPANNTISKLLRLLTVQTV